MTREEVLKGVLRNYARFYLRKTVEYWFERDPFKRRYLLGCLWAFLKTTLNQRFYNLKRVKRKGLRTEVEFGFDESRILTAEQLAQRKHSLSADVDFKGTQTEAPELPTWAAEVSACGGSPSEPTTSIPEPVEQVTTI